MTNGYIKNSSKIQMSIITIEFQIFASLKQDKSNTSINSLKMWGIRWSMVSIWVWHCKVEAAKVCNMLERIRLLSNNSRDLRLLVWLGHRLGVYSDWQFLCNWAVRKLLNCVLINWAKLLMIKNLRLSQRKMKINWRKFLKNWWDS